MTTQNRHDEYLRGLSYGRRLAEHLPLVNHEPMLRLELQLAGQKWRARALGELRGYRQARDD